MDVLFSFAIVVAGNVAFYYIIKWLDSIWR